MSAPTNSVRSAFELTGRNYIITGGAQGIGFTVSRAICEMGGNVAIWDIQEKPVDQKEFDSWSSTFGSKTLYVQTDVTKQDSLEAAFQKTLNVFQTVDGCVPSAGIAIDKPFIDQTWEEFTRIQEINVSKNCSRPEPKHDLLIPSPRCAARSSQHRWSPDT
jgi:sorbose reductase